MTEQRRRLWGGGLVAVMFAGLILAACGGSSPEREADEFIRPAAPDAEPSDAEPSDAEPSDAGNAADVVRRYLSDSYGYSLELVCGPFCDATSPGIDLVRFVSDDQQALIEIRVRPAETPATPDFAALEAFWRADSGVNPSFLVVSREDVVLGSDGVTPAVHLQWEVDQRAFGGLLFRAHTLITQVGPLAYFIEAGAVQEIFPQVERFLLQALDSFIARSDPENTPGFYSKWEFAFPYDPAVTSLELGLRGAIPTFDNGLFVQLTNQGVVTFTLGWESVSQALFDPDDRIEDVLQQGAGVTVELLERGDAQLLGGVDARFAVARFQNQTGVSANLAVYVWYCEDSGRAFLLQSTSIGDAVAQIQPNLDGFRCDDADPAAAPLPPGASSLPAAPDATGEAGEEAEDAASDGTEESDGDADAP